MFGIIPFIIIMFHSTHLSPLVVIYTGEVSLPPLSMVCYTFVSVHNYYSHPQEWVLILFDFQCTIHAGLNILLFHNDC